MIGILRTLVTKTVIGSLIFAAGRIYPNPKDPQAWLEGGGAVITAIGARRAIAKNGTGN